MPVYSPRRRVSLASSVFRIVSKQFRAVSALVASLMPPVEDVLQRIAQAITASAQSPNRSFKRGFARTALLMRKTMRYWQTCDVTKLAAALAFYTMFSLAPMFVILIAVAGLVLGSSASADTFAPLSQVLGAAPTLAIQNIVSSANTKATNLTALVTGVVIAVIGAGGLFGQLQDALNGIFGEPAEPRRGVVEFVRRNVVAIALVLVAGVLFTASLVVEAGSTVVASHHATLVRLIDVAITYATVAVLFAVVYKILPANRLHWSEAIVGGAVTGMLLVLGQAFIGWYLGRAAIGFGYGVAGSLMLVLLWVYYSAITLLLGAAFTRGYMETVRPQAD